MSGTQAMQKRHKVLTTKRFTLEPLHDEGAQLIGVLGADPDSGKNLICDWSKPERRLEVAQYWVERNQEYGIWGIFDREDSFAVPSQFIGFCAADEPLPLGYTPIFSRNLRNRPDFNIPAKAHAVKGFADIWTACRISIKNLKLHYWTS